MGKYIWKVPHTVSVLFVGLLSVTRQDVTSSFGVKGRHKHRKTRSRSSMDWSILAKETNESLEFKPQHQVKPAQQKEQPASNADDDHDFHDESMSSLHLEEEHRIRLPSYVDRLVALA